MMAWQVFDQKVTDMLRDEYRIRRVTKVTGNTLEELAPKLEGVDPDQFLKEVKAYNAAVPDRCALQSPQSSTGAAPRDWTCRRRNWANVLDKPPYEAYAITLRHHLHLWWGCAPTTTAAVLDNRAQSDPGSVRRGRADRRHVLLQLSGRHRPHVRRDFRPHGRQQRRSARQGQLIWRRRRRPSRISRRLANTPYERMRARIREGALPPGCAGPRGGGRRTVGDQPHPGARGAASARGRRAS